MSILTNRKFRLITKAVSLLVVVAFCLQEIAWATNGTPVWSVLRSNGRTNGRFSSSLDISNLAIPNNLGIVKEVYQGQTPTQANEEGSDPRTIIHIQDAHVSFGAQLAISSLIESLVSNYDIKLVALEGSSGIIDTSILGTFPDKRIRQEVSSYFMKQGKLCSAEYFSINNPDKDITLFGVEDKQLYLDNLNRFTEFLKQRPKVLSQINTIKSILNQLKQHIYSDTLLELDKYIQDYRLSKINFTKYFNYINTFITKHNINLKEYPNISSLSKACQLEKQLNFQAADTQRTELVNKLSSILPKQDLETLVLESLTFKLGKISVGSYHNYLINLAQKANIPPDSIKDLLLYTEYVNLYETIELEQLQIESDSLEERIKENLFTTDQERRLSKLYKGILLLEDLFSAKLTTKTLEYYKQNKSDFFPENYITFIQEYAPGYNIEYSLVNKGLYIDTNQIEDSLPTIESFYETALRRNNSLINNTLKKMQQLNQTTAILITGGFHTEGMTNLLKQNNISYIVVQPKFSKDPSARPYEEILTDKKDQLAKLLSNKKYHLATTHYFSVNPCYTHENVVGYISEVILAALSSAALESKDLEDLKRVWLSAYRIVQQSIKGLIPPEEFQNILNRFSRIRIEQKDNQTCAVVTYGDYDIWIKRTQQDIFEIWIEPTKTALRTYAVRKAVRKGKAVDAEIIKEKLTQKAEDLEEAFKKSWKVSPEGTSPIAPPSWIPLIITVLHVVTVFIARFVISPLSENGPQIAVPVFYNPPGTYLEHIIHIIPVIGNNIFLSYLCYSDTTTIPLTIGIISIVSILVLLPLAISRKIQETTLKRITFNFVLGGWMAYLLSRFMIGGFAVDWLGFNLPFFGDKRLLMMANISDIAINVGYILYLFILGKALIDFGKSVFQRFLSYKAEPPTTTAEGSELRNLITHLFPAQLNKLNWIIALIFLPGVIVHEAGQYIYGFIV